MNAAVLWTGGKDSFFALYEAKAKGYNVISLITFVPDKADFLAHPLHFMLYQAASLGLPHHAIIVNEPFEEGYRNAIKSLKEKHNIDILVTGDIEEVTGFPSWIKKCAAGTGIEVVTPLWGRDRFDHLQRILKEGVRVIFSCVKKPYFSGDWVGAELDASLLERLRRMGAEDKIDICGEQGEYHTLAIDGPLFKRPLQIVKSANREREDLAYIDIQEIKM